MKSPCCGAPLVVVLPAYPGIFLMCDACLRVYETRSLVQKGRVEDRGGGAKHMARRALTLVQQQA